jgi:hypothetical protein
MSRPMSKYPSNVYSVVWASCRAVGDLRMTIRPCLALAFIGLASVAKSASRRWQDITTKHRVEAEFVDFDGTKVRLENQITR